MLKTHGEFHSANGKRLVLIVDDELINRELLRLVLEEEYEALTAPDGEAALELIDQNRDTLSLVLLDLLMPGMHGLDVLGRLKEDAATRHIPVIVLTADQKAEVQSLKLGAMDFISKPYPDREVILARVAKAIELTEGREIIRSTERDELTGLYNREFFYRYAEQYDLHHRDADMDAIVVDAHHFRMINERYGKARGDDVLQRIGEGLRRAVRPSGGIVCRREADTFLVYCPHRDDYQALLDAAAVAVSEDGSSGGRVRLRMGVYAHADRTIDMERRFDRANMAADAARVGCASGVALYDNALHESEIYAERLLEDFQQALSERQFKVYYQPKFDIRPESPILASAEALVRWIHPELGFISPGAFIPLFEENGLIQQLDLYVWREAAAQLRDWKARLGVAAPVSVNVSRIDMYDPGLVGTFKGLLEEFGLSPRELLLEITESAYTQDSGQIIQTVNRLRALGFRIEMDDFGTGYSSLNMISSLPIDALKLDMGFIRDAFKDGGDTRMIEVIIDIADYLRVPVIAEGVETREQLDALRAMGCDMVQGYYFSKPVPASGYEVFLEEKKRREAEEAEKAAERAAEAAETAREAGEAEDGERPVEAPSETTGRKEPEEAAERAVEAPETAREAGEVSEEPEGEEADKPPVKAPEAAQQPAPAQPPVKAPETALPRPGGDGVPFAAVAQALAADYFSIYYVDIDTDRFIEYSADAGYDVLGIEKSGEDFFNLSRRNILRVVHPEDQDKVLSAFTKQKVLEALESAGTFTLTYRLLFGETVNHVSLKATRMAGRGERHIVIGVNNISAQLQRDEEYEKARRDSITFSSIAQALAADYFSIYYVDTETDRFIEYSANDEYQALGIEKSGEDFFNLSRRNIVRVVHPEDHDKILAAFTKEKLLSEMEHTGTFTLTYRLMFGETINYVSMKATRMTDRADKHIVIGVNNINAQMQRQLEYDAARAQSDTYSRIAHALSRDYYSIYLVNTETDAYIEYASSADYKNLQVQQSGADFFKEVRRNVLRLVYAEDLGKALAVWDKARLMPELEGGRTFSTTYRLVIDGAPVYINCKVIRMADDLDAKYIVIGVSNVDAQMKRERELTAARERANRDAMTGVKSKHAYMDEVERLNLEIVKGEMLPFAVVVCDVNGLKQVNDTLGHQAGDKLIMDASAIICQTFQHSPVFRVGGDEFVAILKGRDYERRRELVEEMARQNRQSAEGGGVVIACGTAEWRAGEDSRFEAVFDRADTEMYENKTALKRRD